MIVAGVDNEFHVFLYDMDKKDYVMDGIVTHISYSTFPQNWDNDRVLNYLKDECDFIYDHHGRVKSFRIGADNGDIGYWVGIYEILEILKDTAENGIDSVSEGVYSEDDEISWFDFVKQFNTMFVNHHFYITNNLLDTYLRDILKIHDDELTAIKTFDEWVSYIHDPSPQRILIKSAAKK